MRIMLTASFPHEPFNSLVRENKVGQIIKKILDDLKQELEAGDVVFLPNLRFAVEPNEAVLFRPSILGSAKNASFDSATGRIGGTTATGGEAEALRSLMQRFSDAALALVRDLCPS